MNDLDLEVQFRAAMTCTAERVLHPAGRRIYDLVMEEAQHFIGRFVDCSHGGGAFALWMQVSDLYDDPRGPQSEAACEEVGRKAAREWLALDQSRQEAVDGYFARWQSPGPWDVELTSEGTEER